MLLIQLQRLYLNQQRLTVLASIFAAPMPYFSLFLVVFLSSILLLFYLFVITTLQSKVILFWCQEAYHILIEMRNRHFSEASIIKITYVSNELVQKKKRSVIFFIEKKENDFSLVIETHFTPCFIAMHRVSEPPCWTPLQVLLSYGILYCFAKVTTTSIQGLTKTSSSGIFWIFAWLMSKWPTFGF